MPNVLEAQKQAVKAAGEIIADSATSEKIGQDWSMEVTDERGLILFRLDFHVVTSAAVAGQTPAPQAE